MQRNWDVIRKILIAVEALPDETTVLTPDQLEGLTQEVAAYHIRLLIDAGLVDGGSHANFPFIQRLTWEGHEFLDRIKRDTAWNKIKTLARDKGVELSVDAIKALAKAVLEAMLKP